MLLASCEAVKRAIFLLGEKDVANMEPEKRRDLFHARQGSMFIRSLLMRFEPQVG